jgi:hypothetical protein
MFNSLTFKSTQQKLPQRGFTQLDTHIVHSAPAWAMNQWIHSKQGYSSAGSSSSAAEALLR